MNRFHEVDAWLKDVSFPDYTFQLESLFNDAIILLSATYLEKDTETGEVLPQHTRKWLIESSVSKNTFIQTCFKCVLTSVEHRTREWFLYQNRPIFMPHYNVDFLADMSAEREVVAAPLFKS